MPRNFFRKVDLEFFSKNKKQISRNFCDFQQNFCGTNFFANREANFSGFSFIAINDKFGPIYRDKFDKIR